MTALTRLMMGIAAAVLIACLLFCLAAMWMVDQLPH